MLRHRFTFPALFAASLAVLLLAGCRTHTEVQPLPQGPQTFTGTLLPSPLSLNRRGTHVLSGYEKQFVLESSTFVLRSFEQKTVAVTGHFERNLHLEDPPVLVVTTIKPVQEEPRLPWQMRSTGLVLSVPADWKQSEKNGWTTFTIPTPSTTATLDVYTSATAAATGSIITIGGRRSSLVDDPLSGRFIAVVPSKGSETLVLSLNHKSVPAGELSPLREEWLALLRSASFSTSPSSASGNATGTGANIPCGGTAGILCPAGYYCNITDPQFNSGLCKAKRS